LNFPQADPVSNSVWICASTFIALLGAVSAVVVERMGDVRNYYKILIGKPSGKKPHGQVFKKCHVRVLTRFIWLR
jgi:hypothetical protein